MSKKACNYLHLLCRPFCGSPELEFSAICWQEDPSKFQQGRKSGECLKVKITAVKGPMAVISTGASISGKCKEIKKTFRHWVWKNLRIRVIGQELLCFGFLAMSNKCLGVVL